MTLLNTLLRQTLWDIHGSCVFYIHILLLAPSAPYFKLHFNSHFPGWHTGKVLWHLRAYLIAVLCRDSLYENLALMGTQLLLNYEKSQVYSMFLLYIHYTVPLYFMVYVQDILTFLYVGRSRLSLVLAGLGEISYCGSLEPFSSII